MPRGDFFMAKIFKDISKAGKDRQWRERKLQAIKYGQALEQLGVRRFRDTYTCANLLTYGQKADGGLHLKQAFFCQQKLCPICSWRRSMKNGTRNSQIVEEALKREPKARFVFLTLSARNVRTGEELNQAMSKLTAGFNRLFRRAKVKKNLLGFIRATEVTVSDDPDMPEWQGSYNQHMHVLMMVRPNYFGDTENYIPQAQWVSMWKQSLKADYEPVVDVRIVKPKKAGGDTRSAVLETSKYPVKPIQFDLTPDTLKATQDLLTGLHRKRQLAYGGLLKEIKKELFGEDKPEDQQDLVHVDEETGEILDGEDVVAAWDWQRRNYYIQHGEIIATEVGGK